MQVFPGLGSVMKDVKEEPDEDYSYVNTNTLFPVKNCVKNNFCLEYNITNCVMKLFKYVSFESSHSGTFTSDVKIELDDLKQGLDSDSVLPLEVWQETDEKFDYFVNHLQHKIF